MPKRGLISKREENSSAGPSDNSGAVSIRFASDVGNCCIIIVEVVVITLCHHPLGCMTERGRLGHKSLDSQSSRALGHVFSNFHIQEMGSGMEGALRTVSSNGGICIGNIQSNGIWVLFVCIGSN